MFKKPKDSLGSHWNIGRWSQTSVTLQGPRESYFLDVLWGSVASVSQPSHQPPASTAFGWWVTESGNGVSDSAPGIILACVLVITKYKLQLNQWNVFMIIAVHSG